MKIKLNGEDEDIPEGLSVEGLLDHLKIEKIRVAVELNQVIVPKGEFEQTSLSENDVIEIVGFVGGG